MTQRVKLSGDALRDGVEGARDALAQKRQTPRHADERDDEEDEMRPPVVADRKTPEEPHRDTQPTNPPVKLKRVWYTSSAT